MADDMFESGAESQAPPEPGGEGGTGSILDQFVRSNPNLTKKIMEGAMMSPRAAYKHWYGESPSIFAGKNPDFQAHLETHTKVRDALLGDVMENITNPAYGRSVSEGANILGVKPEDFASPTQYKRGPDLPSVDVAYGPGAPVELQGPGAPQPRFSPGELESIAKAGGGVEASQPLLGSLAEARDEGPRPTIEGPRPIGTRYTPNPNKELDPNAPMNALQRAEVSATLKRMGSPWYGGMRGTAANTMKMAQDAASAKGLVPGTPEHNDYIANFIEHKGGVLKSDYASGAGERLTNARADKTSAQATTEQAKAVNAKRMEDAKYRNLESQIAARSKSAADAHLASMSLRKLRESQTLVNDARREGTLPEEKLRELHEQNMENQRDFVRKYIGAIDPKDLLKPETQDLLIQSLAPYFDVEGDIGTEKAGMGRQLLQGLGVTEKPDVKAKPKAKPATKPQAESRGTVAPAEVPKEGMIAPEMLKELGDLSKYEGKTITDSDTGKKYKIVNGQPKEVSGGE